jgi:hypothetical protein
MTHVLSPALGWVRRRRLSAAAEPSRRGVLHCGKGTSAGFAGQESICPDGEDYSIPTRGAFPVIFSPRIRIDGSQRMVPITTSSFGSPNEAQMVSLGLMEQPLGGDEDCVDDVDDTIRRLNVGGGDGRVVDLDTV